MPYNSMRDLMVRLPHTFQSTGTPSGALTMRPHGRWSSRKAGTSTRPSPRFFFSLSQDSTSSTSGWSPPRAWQSISNATARREAARFGSKSNQGEPRPNERGEVDLVMFFGFLSAVWPAGTPQTFGELNVPRIAQVHVSLFQSAEANANVLSSRTGHAVIYDKLCTVDYSIIYGCCSAPHLHLSHSIFGWFGISQGYLDFVIMAIS